MSYRYYDLHALDYYKETVSADMSFMLDLFIDLLKAKSKILDAGCGSGRDSLYFIKRGFVVDAMDASLEMVKLSKITSGVETMHLCFEEMTFINQYDGIWCNAALLHVARSDLLNVFSKFARALKTGGILYASFKNGTDFTKDDRIFTCFNEGDIVDFVNNTKQFEIIKVIISEDVRPSRSDLWINIFLKKL